MLVSKESLQQHIHDIPLCKIRLFTRRRELNGTAPVVQLNQLPHPPDPRIPNNNYLVSLNWCPRYQVGGAYGDLRPPPSLDHGHNDIVRLWLDLLPCCRYCLCSVSLKLSMRRQCRKTSDVIRNTFLPYRLLEFFCKKPMCPGLPGVST